MRVPPRAALLLGAAVLAAAAACRSPQSKLQESRETLRSWRASARLAADEWARGRHPGAFTKTVADALRDAAHDERSKLAKIGTDEARALVPAADGLAAAADRLSRAVESGDRTAASALAADLAAPEPSR